MQKKVLLLKGKSNDYASLRNLKIVIITVENSILGELLNNSPEILKHQVNQSR